MPYEYKDIDLLKRFINERFDVPGLIKAGFLKKEQRRDYVAIANRISEYFGYENVYEYGKESISCHLTMNNRGNEPFVTTIPNIYE